MAILSLRGFLGIRGHINRTEQKKDEELLNVGLDIGRSVGIPSHLSLPPFEFSGYIS